MEHLYDWPQGPCWVEGNGALGLKWPVSEAESEQKVLAEADTQKALKLYFYVSVFQKAFHHSPSKTQKLAFILFLLWQL